MSKVIQLADQQIETGFVVSERAVGISSQGNEDLEDGTPESEQARRWEDPSRN
jgi:hypothetical protein